MHIQLELEVGVFLWTQVTTVAEREGIAILPWSPLKGGWLSGKMNRDEESAPDGSRVHSQTKDGVKNQSGPNW